MSQANVDVVRTMVEAFNRGDLAAVTAAFAEDCRVDEPPEMPDQPAGGYRGRDGVGEWMMNLRDLLGIRFEPIGLEARGDVVVSELVGRGLGQASGAPVEWTTFVVIEVRDGKIVRVRAFLSREQALAAASSA